VRGALLLDKMELIDERFVTEAGGERAKALRHKRMIVLVAAVLALVIIAAPTVILIANKTIGGDYSASYVGGLFPGTYDSVGTNRYAKVYVPDISALKYDGGDLPEGQTITVYKRDVSGKAIDMKELQCFVDERLPGLSAALGYEIAVKEYKTFEESIISYAALATSDGGYALSAYQNSINNSIVLSKREDSVLVFGGETVAVDVRLTDEELAKALEPLRKKLCDAFGVDFSDMKILKEYSYYSAALLKSLMITFYSKNEHPLNDCVDLRAGSCIELYFVIDEDGNEPPESDGTLWRVSPRFIRCISLRVPAEKYFRAEKECDLISLEEAEELLKKGYVFDGHSCPLCMASQQPVDFEDYDAVRFKSVDGFPFYAFYKKIEDLPNGCIEYARTLVPAVRVVDLEEYFESQEPKHSFYAQFDTTAT